MPYTDTFLGNYTFNLTDLALIEKGTKRPRMRVTFHEKVEGKSGPSEKRKEFITKPLNIMFRPYEEEKIVLAGNNAILVNSLYLFTSSSTLSIVAFAQI